jgi:uncharacterized protein YycO
MTELPLFAGDILLYSGKDLVDTVIREVTMSDWNHVAVVMPGENTMVEALPGGVQIAPITEMGENVWHVQTGLIWDEKATAFVKSVLGEPYSYLNDLLAGLGYPPATEKAWECAQLASKILEILGMKLPSVCNTPQEVAMACAKKGCLFQFLPTQAEIANAMPKLGG